MRHFYIVFMVKFCLKPCGQMEWNVLHMSSTRCCLKPPYEMIHGKKANGKYLLRTCVCSTLKELINGSQMPRNLVFGLDKQKKGWKCMDFKTHKYFVSRDVFFDKFSSYYELYQVSVEWQDVVSSLMDYFRVSCESENP